MKYYIKTLILQKKIMDKLAIFFIFVLFGMSSNSCCRDKKDKPDECNAVDVRDKNAPAPSSIDKNVPIPTSSPSSSCVNSSSGLNRFHDAQTPAILAAVDKELRNGRKESHWIWFIFPQIDGLGNSPGSKRYSIKSLNEAREYLKDKVLYGNLIKHVQLVRNHKNKKLIDIFGAFGNIDKQKFISSMTLFYLASDDFFFSDTLKGFGENLDAKTIRLAGKANN
jgi:uncharacterized protein (DUF1810 family)